jgi:N-acetylneuraminate synthase
MISIIAEIGINHNGDINLAKQLIDVAKSAGCDFVKFQKRNPDVCVPEDQKLKIRQTPWGEMSYIDYKHRTEFGFHEYNEINRYCELKGIGWFASAWDLDSVDFLKQFPQQDGKVIMKIASAKITDIDLCVKAREESDVLLISTGMSTEQEVERCIKASRPDVVFHTNSTYPCPVSELNLNYIHHLNDKYDVEVGYSGHEYGLATTFATAAMGVTWIERHITLDRRMWGSDQSASVEPAGLHKLVRGIRNIDQAMGSAGPREVLGGELAKKKSLRG